MIITRTPFRISFFGGGSDYREWYIRHGGMVLSSTINRYCYLSVRRLPPFFPYKHRIVWSQTELVKEVKQILHPAVRGCMEFLNLGEEGIEITHSADLPARSGLGSSSAFTVGLINALNAVRAVPVTKKIIAGQAIHVEREVLKETVGIQDQIACAYGGLNLIKIQNDGTYDVYPVEIDDTRLREFQAHFMLFFTGLQRHASEIAAAQVSNFERREAELRDIVRLVGRAHAVLLAGGKLDDFGALLHHGWLLKRSLAEEVSNSHIDELYARARDAGAIGGKVLGAGGGGFMAFFVKPEEQPAVRAELSDLLEVPFEFEDFGTEVLLSH